MHPFWEIYQSLFRKAEKHTKITCNRTTCCITLQIINVSHRTEILKAVVNIGLLVLQQGQTSNL